MAERPQLVVDATIGVASVLRVPDEPFTDLSRQVFRDFGNGRIHLVAPHHFYAEVGHALLSALRRRRISEADAEYGLEVLYTSGIETIRHTGVLRGGWTLANRYRCSFYDAGYLALAVMTDSQFVHADKHLSDRLNGLFPNEMWIEDYM
ncbi:MAG: type II toxin-antitoxin system VapC family toxin [Chloroflexi bacterium]|nr:type II toxin-antitoxin system VapC family toxin [Chloroflexota bacterium]